ncbi:hypothetical protein SAMN05445060_2716 [Williamsia sterculiae]|uniref:Uncharacterized protein n=1 Tax=Williamsia sterculiae TaxID=1344003 RepID=A0A1N7GFH1_9NOCA|nr:hypothetical protein SAMN05445060_2716 [Williamsia sterculiae]
MADRDERAKEITQIVCIIAVVVLAWVDAQPSFDVPQVAYWILGGIALGVRDIRKLLGGGDERT